VRYALPTAPLHAQVRDAGHYVFLAPCPPAMIAAVPEICLDPENFDRAAFHREFNAAVVSFFRSQLR
jgi:predicted dienelactone hydrolase